MNHINGKGDRQQLSRAQKILVTLYQLSKATPKQVRFEEIAVGVYKNFPSDFQLRGYPQYPDTGDIVHKPLYSELKKSGYVLSGNKYFSLTTKGLSFANQLTKFLTQSDSNNIPDANIIKLTADQQKELERLKSSSAVGLFLKGQKNEILDIDFYSYLGVTVRTDKNNFIGRLSVVQDAIMAIKGKSGTLYQSLHDCHQYLLEKFKENVDYVKNSRGGRR